MKKFTITFICVFLAFLLSFSVVSELIGTSPKYASNQDYMQSKNLALKIKAIK